MLDFVLLVLFLIFVFRIVASGLQKQPGAAAAGAAGMGDHGNVHIVTTVQEWDAKLAEGEKDKKVIVVDFTAVWCGPCKMMAPIFANLSKKFTDVIFLKVDVDQLHDIAGQWDVQAMPTFIFIKDKKLVHKIVGANQKELELKAAFFSAIHDT